MLDFKAYVSEHSQCSVTFVPVHDDKVAQHDQVSGAIQIMTTFCNNWIYPLAIEMQIEPRLARADNGSATRDYKPFWSLKAKDIDARIFITGLFAQPEELIVDCITPATIVDWVNNAVASNGTMQTSEYSISYLSTLATAIAVKKPQNLILESPWGPLPLIESTNAAGHHLVSGPDFGNVSPPVRIVIAHHDYVHFVRADFYWDFWCRGNPGHPALNHAVENVINRNPDWLAVWNEDR